MIVSLIFLFCIMAVVIGWLLRHTFNTQPWVAEATVTGEDPAALNVSAKKLGLLVFIAIVISFFSLFISAYAIRMDIPDWRPLTEPKVLWFNTLLLVASSIAMQWSQVAAGKGQLKNAHFGMLLGGATAIGFLFGQLIAWRELVAAGAYVYSNPANAFFYVITALHGLHLLGGLLVLGHAVVASWRVDFDTSRLRQSIELCTIYWHFLLLMWLGLFWLLLST